MGNPADITEATATLRVCDEPGCDTVLSRYNELDFCALHQPMITPRMRGKVLDRAPRR